MFIFFLKDSLTDCYANPLESLETINRLNYVQTKTTQQRVIEIPVIDCRKEQRVLDYKDVDHAKTNALREVTEQRIQQKSFISIFISKIILLFCL